VLTLALYAATLRAQTLTITPDRALTDEPVTIRATGLQPNQHAIIHADLIDGAGNPWSSDAEFVADSQGTIDASQQAPVKGSYNELSAMGLIWSMIPAEKHVDDYKSPADLGPQIVNFHLIVDNKPVSNAQLERLNLADGVRRIKVQGALHGELFVPSSGDRHPAVLVLGGSEGGVPLRNAAWLASHGFVALALAYFRYGDLPPDLEAIPLEYFSSALAWLLQRPEVSPGQVAVLGASRGGELALQLGSLFPQLKAVVAYVPSNVRNSACCGATRVPLCLDLERPSARLRPAPNARSLNRHDRRHRGRANPRAHNSNFWRRRRRLALLADDFGHRRSPPARALRISGGVFEISPCRTSGGPLGDCSRLARQSDAPGFGQRSGLGRHREGRCGILAGRHTQGVGVSAAESRNGLLRKTLNIKITLTKH
jgi:dienelactone hydrolase